MPTSLENISRSRNSYWDQLCLWSNPQIGNASCTCPTSRGQLRVTKLSTAFRKMKEITAATYTCILSFKKPVFRLLWTGLFTSFHGGNNVVCDAFFLFRFVLKWYMNYFTYGTADLKSSKLWSLQLWTQLHREAWKGQDFNGVWTRDLAIPVRRSSIFEIFHTSLHIHSSRAH